MITTPSIASVIAALPAFDSHTASAHEPIKGPAPYKVRDVPGKGLGLVANRTIHRGERLFAVPVIGIFHQDSFPKRRSESVNELERLFYRSATQLPEGTGEKFWALAAHEEKLREISGAGVVGRLNTNTFGEDFGGVEHSIVAPETAVSASFGARLTKLILLKRMNHDCRPK